MPRIPLPLTAMLLACLPLGWALSSSAGVGDAARTIEGTARDASPGSRAEGGAAMDGAIAAAVIGTVVEQFGSRMVEVKLDAMAVSALSLRDRQVDGHGRLRIDNEDEWLPFRYRALYDTQTTTVEHPRLTLGADDGQGRALTADSVLATALGQRVSERLTAEFADQHFDFQLDRVSIHESGSASRYARVSGSGLVDFGREGAAEAQVEALFDRRKQQWVRIDYELGNAVQAMAKVPGAKALADL